MFFLTIFWPKMLRNGSTQILDLLISAKMLFEHEPVGTGWQFHNGRYKLIFPISITLKMSL